MTLELHREILDRQRGINREKVYGSERAHFPYPHKSTSSVARPTRFGTPGVLIRNNKDSNKITNFEHIQNLKEISKLLSSIS